MDQEQVKIEYLRHENERLRKEILSKDTYIAQINSSFLNLEKRTQNIGISKEDVMLALFGKKKEIVI